MTRPSLTLVVAAALAVMSSMAHAEELGAPPSTLSYENTLFGRDNPLGVADEFDLRYRIPLYQSGHPALAQNFFGIVAPWLLAPSLFRPGIGVEVQPLSLLHLYVGYEPTIYFGDLGSLHSFPSPSGDYGSGAFQVGGPAALPGAVYPAVVHELVLAATAQLAVRWFALRSTWRGQYVHASLRNGDTVFYDSFYVVLLPRSGWLLHTETDAVYRSHFGLTAGLHYALSMTSYPASAYPAGEAVVNRNTPIQQLGPIVAYTLFEHSRRGRFEAPTFFLLVAWYLEDRYRTGQLVNQAIPMIGLGLSFRGSLAEWGRR